MPFLIPIIASGTGLIIGWLSNDVVDSVSNEITEVKETVTKSTNYAAIGIAAVIGFVVLRKIKVI